MDPVPRIATVGVYDFDAHGFIETLDEAGVTQLIDVRQRRGVRGAQYAWANSQRLQGLLADARIGYEYHPALAPDTERFGFDVVHLDPGGREPADHGGY